MSSSLDRFQPLGDDGDWNIAICVGVNVFIIAVFG